MSIHGATLEVEWQGEGTLLASADPSAEAFTPVGSASPHEENTFSRRFYKVLYETSNYMVVDTSQATAYDEFGQAVAVEPGEVYFGQDAHFTGHLPDYVDNGDGTVTDQVTGLMWQQVPPEAFYSWPEAQGYAEKLILGDHDDWRLPTMKELLSLANFTGSSRPEINKPYIDDTVFTLYDPLTVSTFVPASANRTKRSIDGQFWSSNAYVGRTINNDSATFGFNFIDGRIKGYPNGVLSGPTGTAFVRCVRGPVDYGENNFVDNGDGTITDLATGLMWMKDDSGATVGALDWIEALDWAETLEVAGHADWRLPNAKELHTLVDYTRAPDAEDPERRTAAIDPVFNISEMESWFWTSTSLGDDLFEWAIYICFGKALAVDRQTLEPTVNAHGAGAMRSDPKSGDPADFTGTSGGHGPQNDQVRIRNYARAVRKVLSVNQD
jgi:hypothetical protein